ncbi:MAG: SDR family oxidoreductase [Lachnospiraceae bacterium]|nr:SDR family oxidoreductase [Lachnospiraceae bacterium]
MAYKDLRFPEDSLFLITGGAGFIGSNLCEAILKLGYRVRCLDDLSTGKEENVTLFLNNPNYEFRKGDIKDIKICMDACKDVNYVLHQAAWGSVPRSIEMPLFYCANNITGTLNMLEAARQNHVKKFVYASSSSVYGDEPGLPKAEGREGNLLSPYAVSKRADEEWAKQYTRHYGLDTYGLRYFNVFGRRQDPNGAYAAVIPKFIRQLLNGEIPTINGDGRQSRDFTYIENVIEANFKACLADHDAAGEAYNIAFGGREYLIDIYYGLVDALGIKDCDGNRPEPNFGPDRVGDIKHSNADISKAKEKLGYDPEWSFEQGINAAIKWYKYMK